METLIKLREKRGPQNRDKPSQSVLFWIFRGTGKGGGGGAFSLSNSQRGPPPLILRTVYHGQQAGSSFRTSDTAMYIRAYPPVIHHLQFEDARLSGARLAGACSSKHPSPFLVSRAFTLSLFHAHLPQFLHLLAVTSLFNLSRESSTASFLFVFSFSN